MPRRFEAAPSHRFFLLIPYALVALGLFTIVRLALWIHSLPDLDGNAMELAQLFGRGFLYDLGFLSYFLLPFLVYLTLLPQRVLVHPLHRLFVHLGYFAFLYGLFFTGVAEWLFWDEFGARFNFISVAYLVYRREVSDNIAESYPLVPLLLAILAATVATWWGVRPALRRAFDAPPTTLLSRLAIAVPLALLPVATYFGLDQSQLEFSANRYANELAGNGPYQFIAAFRNNSLDYRTFYRLGDDAQLSAVLHRSVSGPEGQPEGDGLYDIGRQIHASGSEHRWNVILISVESLNADYFTTFGGKKALTPNLDRLAEGGLLFTSLYATGTRTVRGLEAITLSLPPTPGSALVKRPDNAGLDNLGDPFRARGYDTAYLYGGFGYFDNMNAFFSGNGYRVIDQSDMSSEEITFRNAWGVADEDIYRRAVKEADQDQASGRPFFFHIMTTSNHRPYTYPEGRVDIPSGDGRNGAVKYTDWAIGNLIAEASKRPWFDDTLFVIVADHCAGSAGKDALTLENYHIPLLVYAPKRIAPRRVDTLSSQLDLAPTLLGLLDFEYESWFFGRDIMQMAPDEGRALVGTYQLVGLYRGDRLMYLAPRGEVAEIESPLGAPVLRRDPPADALIEEGMAFYQGADYILSHRLNRWQANGNRDDQRQLVAQRP